MSQFLSDQRAMENERESPGDIMIVGLNDPPVSRNVRRKVRYRVSRGFLDLLARRGRSFSSRRASPRSPIPPVPWPLQRLAKNSIDIDRHVKSSRKSDLTCVKCRTLNLNRAMVNCSENCKLFISRRLEDWDI